MSSFSKTLHARSGDSQRRTNKMATTPVGSSSTTDSTKSSVPGGFGNLKLDDFMKMLLAELQNQDPLSPMDASQMLTQIGQITQVGSTQQLTSTLDSVLL